MPPDIDLPDRIKIRLVKLQNDVDSILDGAERFLRTQLPDPVKFEFVNSAPSDVLSDYDRAQSVSFVTRYDHLPNACKVTAAARDGRYYIENIDQLRHALNEFRPLIQNQSDSVYYQKIHNVWRGMLLLEDPTKGTTIRVFDLGETDVTNVYIRWLDEANKAIRHVLAQLEYGYLYNGVLQHSNAKYSSRFIEDYISGEFNYIMGKMRTCWIL